MSLETFWFILIAVLWTGYLVLDGFDLGVGMLLPVIGRSTAERRQVINTIGPVWDGNEVWLLVAGGATFAAFPGWYATLFSAAYLPLLLVLVGLIIRGVGFEWRAKHPSDRWGAWWDRGIFVGSLLPAVLWGAAWASVVRGIPVDPDGEFTGNLFSWLHPFALLGGVTTALLFLAQGAHYLALKSDGDVLERARAWAPRLTVAAASSMLLFLGWMLLIALDADDTGVVPGPVPVTAALLMFAAVWFAREHRSGWAFTAGAAATAMLVATWFANLYPRVLISSTHRDDSPTIYDVASTTYTLKVMTVVALVMTPVVIIYQGWTYYVFRHRVTAPAGEPLRSPIDLVAAATGGTPSPRQAADGTSSGDVDPGTDGTSAAPSS